MTVLYREKLQFQYIIQERETESIADYGVDA